jgi:hypothetical protein
MSSSATLTCQVVTQGPGPAVEFFPRSSERSFFVNGKTNPVQKASLIEEALGCTGAVWSSAGCFKRGGGRVGAAGKAHRAFMSRNPTGHCRLHCGRGAHVGCVPRERDILRAFRVDNVTVIRLEHALLQEPLSQAVLPHVVESGVLQLAIVATISHHQQRPTADTKIVVCEANASKDKKPVRTSPEAINRVRVLVHASYPRMVLRNPGAKGYMRLLLCPLTVR